MELFGIIGLLAVLFVKEAGVPIPVPGDLLVLGAGVATAGDPAAAGIVLIGILIAGYTGGSVQFLIARGALRRAILGLLTKIGVPRERIDALADRLRRGGARAVAICRTTPGVRVPAIAASGLAGLPFRTFAAGLVVGNTLFVGAHFVLGFVVGVPAVNLVQAAGPVVGAVVFAALAALGAIGWFLIRRRRRAARASDAEREGFAAWADAACPACLGLALLPTPR